MPGTHLYLFFYGRARALSPASSPRSTSAPARCRTACSWARCARVSKIARGLPEARRVLRRTRGRRCRADRHRRLCTEHHRLAQADEHDAAPGLAIEAASTGHRCGARARRADLPAVLHGSHFGYPPLQVAPLAIEAPIDPSEPRALSARGGEQPIEAFARTARLARDGATMASRSWVRRVISSTSPPRHARAGASMRTAAAPRITCASRPKLSAASAKPAARLHPHLSPVDGRPRRRQPRMERSHCAGAPSKPRARR
jgi:hypothetical protein